MTSSKNHTKTLKANDHWDKNNEKLTRNSKKSRELQFQIKMNCDRFDINSKHCDHKEWMRVSESVREEFSEVKLSPSESEWEWDWEWVRVWEKS